MLDYSFEHDGDRGRLILVTHFGDRHEINCEKEPHQTFRPGGTGGAGIRSVPCQVLAVESELVTFLVAGVKLTTPNFASGVQVGKTAYVSEYYPLDAEGQRPGFFVSRKPIERPDILFVNVDCLDGGGNLMKRYRISTYDGKYTVI